MKISWTTIIIDKQLRKYNSIDNPKWSMMLDEKVVQVYGYTTLLPFFESNVLNTVITGSIFGQTCYSRITCEKWCLLFAYFWFVKANMVLWTYYDYLHQRDADKQLHKGLWIRFAQQKTKHRTKWPAVTAARCKFKNNKYGGVSQKIFRYPNER